MSWHSLGIIPPFSWRNKKTAIKVSGQRVFGLKLEHWASRIQKQYSTNNQT
jgi:hypothetical protein